MIFKENVKSADVRFRIIIVLIMLIAAAGILAPVIAPHDPYSTDLLNTLKPPCREFIFGTDSLGRCIFSRVL